MKIKTETLPIGILTYHRAVNYGAVLQAYALQNKIDMLGQCSVVIDYLNPLNESVYKKHRIRDIKSLKDIGKYLLIYRNSNKRIKKFSDFREKYIKTSKVYKDKKELISDESKFSTFIVGSDQVWNPYLNSNDDVYLLNITSHSYKKNAYAASFGFSEFPEEFKEEFSTKMKDFNNIFVRENQAVNMVTRLINKNSEVVLDPTFLLESKEWESIVPDSNYKNKYIFIYAFSGSKNIKKLALEMSKKFGYKIYWLTYGFEFSLKINYLKDIGPLEFLSLIKNAEFVITNSFHGTAFSIIFNKQFYLEYLPDSYSVNSRLENIIKSFELENNILTDRTVIENLSIINYNVINETLITKRRESLEKLNVILESTQYE